MSSAPPITPIDLSVFAEIIDNARADNNSGVVATIGRDGPDVGFKGSLLVWDKDHVAWWERTLRETYAAIQNDPRVCVLVRNTTRAADHPLLRSDVGTTPAARRIGIAWCSSRRTPTRRKGAAVLWRRPCLAGSTDRSV